MQEAPLSTFLWLTFSETNATGAELQVLAQTAWDPGQRPRRTGHRAAPSLTPGCPLPDVQAEGSGGPATAWPPPPCGRARRRSRRRLGHTQGAGARGDPRPGKGPQARAPAGADTHLGRRTPGFLGCTTSSGSPPTVVTHSLPRSMPDSRVLGWPHGAAGRLPSRSRCSENHPSCSLHARAGMVCLLLSSGSGVRAWPL